MSKSTSLASLDSKRWVLPAIVFFIALGLRLIGIGWGLPNQKHLESYHPDESVVWAYSQAIQPTSFQFTPGFYNYGTLYLTTLKVASDVVAGYSGGGLDPKKSDEAWGFIGKSELAGRILSTLAGSATPLIVFLILRRFSNDFGSVCGGLLIAFAPAHVVHSKYQTVDVLAVFFLALSTLFALRLIRREDLVEKASDMKLAILSGVFAGLSAGTKYTGIFCLFTVMAVVWLVHGKAGLKLIAASVGAAVAAFLITTPGAILESSIFIKDFVFEMKHTSQGHGWIFEGTSPGFVYQLANLFLGVGLVLSLLGLAGLGGGAFRKHAWAIGLLAFFIPYYILIGRAEVKFMRYSFPLYIGLGVGFGWLIGRAREKGGKWHGMVGLGLLGLGGLFGGGLQSTGRYLAWTASEDPREQAGDYLRGKDVSIGVPTDPWFYTPAFHPNLGMRLVFPPDSPYVVNSSYGQRIDAAVQEMTQPKIIRYAPLLDGVRDLASRSDWDIRLLTESKPDYVVYSSFETEGLDRISKMENAEPVAKATAKNAEVFMDQLKKDYAFDRMFGAAPDLVHDMMYVQPTVYVWKRKANP